jgi:hypothetical protein
MAISTQLMIGKELWQYQHSLPTISCVDIAIVLYQPLAVLILP